MRTIILFFIPMLLPTLLFSQNDKQKLDSLIIESYDTNTQEWNLGSKEEYIYDADENWTTHWQFSRDNDTQQWVNYTHSEHTYDNIGNLISSIRRFWHNTGEWRNQGKSEIAYNANNQYTLHITYDWDNALEEWHPNSKTEFAYDSADLLEQEIQYAWHNMSAQWLPNSKQSMSYNSDGDPILSILQAWDENTAAWVNYWRFTDTYTPTTKTTEVDEWNSTTAQWTNLWKYDYNYDVVGNLLDYNTSYWNNDTEIWINSNRRTFTYDNQSNQTQRWIYKWDEDTAQWLNENQTNYTYDTYSNLIQEIRILWDVNTQAWINNIRDDYSYDYDYLIEDLIFPTPPTHHHKKNNNIRYEWNENTEEWIFDRKRIYHYSEQIVSITSPQNTQLNIFPNPANDVINFDLENPSPAIVRLHNVQGKYIGDQLLQNNRLLVSHLNSGTYFYELFYKGEMFSGKFIVK